MKLIRGKIAIVPFAQAEETIRVLNAIAVLNLACEIDWSPPNGIEYAKVPLDNDRNNMCAVLAAVNILEDLCDRQPPVVVHCIHAVNRSPAIVAAWLLAHEKQPSWSKAVAEVYKARSPLDMHRGLLRTIRDLFDNGPTEQEISEAEH